MTLEEFEDLKQYESEILKAYRSIQHAKQAIIGAFDLMTIDYDSEQDVLCFVADCGEDDFGTHFEVKNSLEEMLDSGWFELEFPKEEE